MKNNSQFARFRLITVWILLAALGIYIADRTYQYDVVVKGALGFTVLYLLFSYIRYSGIDATVERMLSDPKIYRYLIFAFFGAGLSYWAMGGFFDMLSIFVKYLAKFVK